uniref:Uncharacterized protein n=1 Tax=viral metagenome TaxID=1070528 RepID=A0A6M3L655_9ZZZZ
MIVQLPDGKTAEFPDNMSKDQVAAVLRKQYSNPSREMSTITGKPVPTSEENIKQSMGVAKTVGPIMGDIAMTAITPQLGVPLKGASIAARYGSKLGNLALRMMGSAAGSGAGSIAGQKIAGQDVNMEEAGKEALLGAAGEGVIAPVGAALKFAGGKVAKPVMELMSDMTFLGSGLKEKLRKNMIKTTTDRATTFVTDLAPDIVKKQKVGLNDLGAQISSALDESRVAYSLYEEPLEKFAAANKGRVNIDNAVGLMNDLKEEIYYRHLKLRGKKPTEARIDLEFMQEIGADPKQRFELKKITDSGDASPEQVKYLLATIFKSGKKGFNQLSPTPKAMREKLKEALKLDLQNISASGGKTAGQLKTEADETFKAVKQFQFIKRMYDGAFREIPETGEKALQPMKLAKAIYESKGRILKEMPELWPKLEKEAILYESIAPEFAKGASQQITGINQLIARGSGGTIGSFLIGPAGFPVAEGLGMISAYAVMSPSGRNIIKKMVSQSLKATAKTGIHLGGKPVMMKSHD